MVMIMALYFIADVHHMPEAAGVFGLYNQAQEVIFYGLANVSVRAAIQRQLGLTCTAAAGDGGYYDFETSDQWPVGTTTEARLNQKLQAYAADNGGQLPECNT